MPSKTLVRACSLQDLIPRIGTSGEILKAILLLYKKPVEKSQWTRLIHLLRPTRLSTFFLLHYASLSYLQHPSRATKGSHLTFYAFHSHALRIPRCDGIAEEEKHLKLFKNDSSFDRGLYCTGWKDLLCCSVVCEQSCLVLFELFYSTMLRESQSFRIARMRNDCKSGHL